MQDTLARRLRVLRAERGLTLRDAERLTGVDKDTLSKIERGVRHPQDVTLARIAKGYEVPVEELIEEPALAGKAEAPLSPERALSIADDDSFRRTIEAVPTEELRGLVVELVRDYKPLSLGDARSELREEAVRRVMAFSRAILIDEELERRGAESPEIYPIVLKSVTNTLKSFVDATTPPETPVPSQERSDQETA